MPIYVNKTEITDDAVFKEMQYHSGENRENVQTAAARALVIKELLLQQATKLGMNVSFTQEEDIDKLLMTLVEKEVSAPATTSKICARYYEQNQERFRAADAPDHIVPFYQVEEKIRNYLHTRSIREGIRSYILSLAEGARIAGFDLTVTL